MRKVLVMAVVLVFFGGAVFASWSSWEDYQTYKKAKANASAASDGGDTVTAVAEYKLAAELASKSGTKEYQGWQLNNAAYALIKKFKADTEYQVKIDKLSLMEPGSDKIEYQKEIAAVFEGGLMLLEEAQAILDEAKALFPEAEVAAEEAEKKEEEKEGEEGQAEEQPALSGPMVKIVSNIEFIAWVKKFVDENK